MVIIDLILSHVVLQYLCRINHSTVKRQSGNYKQNQGKDRRNIPHPEDRHQKETVELET